MPRSRLKNLLRSLRRRKRNRKSWQKHTHRRLLMQPLEDRRMLAQGPQLLVDVNTDTASSIGGHDAAAMGSYLYFAADDGVSGSEVWRTNGSTAASGTELIHELTPLSGGSNPENFTYAAGWVYFTAETSGSLKLHRTNGGTHQTLSGFSKPDYYDVNSIAVVGSTMYFSVVNGSAGELWKANGSTAIFLKSFSAPSGAKPIDELTAVGSSVFFTASDYSRGQELWKTTGYSGTTGRVKDIKSGSGSSTPSDLTEFDGYLFFSAADSSNGRELWRSDGTDSGTIQKTSFSSGSYSTSFYGIEEANSDLYVSVRMTSPTDHRLYGYATPTSLPQLIKDGSSSSFSRMINLTDVNGTLYFTQSNGLYKATGTTDTYIRSLPSSYSSGFTNVNGTLYFQTSDSGIGRELWMSQGDFSNTGMVKDIFPGSNSSYATVIGNLGSTAIISANDGVSGTELWRSSGSSGSTWLLEDINAASVGSDPSEFTQFKGETYFVAYDDNYGYELWKTNGLTGNRSLVADVTSGHGSSNLSDLTVFNGELFFLASDVGSTNRDLWKTDGTSTAKAYDASRIDDIEVFDGELYLTGSGSLGVDDLWKSDGTSAGTTLFVDVWPGSTDDNVGNLTATSNALYFSADGGGGSGVEIWRTDGTVVGTFEVADVNSGSGSSTPQHFTEVSNEVFFAASDSTGDRELWKTDGSVGNVAQVADIHPTTSSDPQYLTNFNGQLYFSATHPMSGVSLMTTDGTTLGTTVVKSFSGSVAPRGLTEYDGDLYFAANNGTQGEELWQSDGTTTGTDMVQDIFVGSASSQPSSPGVSFGVLYFPAHDGAAGSEVWTLENDVFDYGDARSPYPTRIADVGARHVATGVTLGAARDIESDGLPSASADGDDTTGRPDYEDDEDGVTIGLLTAGDNAATVSVDVTGSSGLLDAWIDFNDDGSWGGPFEQIADSVTVNSGDNTITFDVPSWAASGNTYARFRISAAGNLGPSGPAADGEVEDYRVTIDPPSGHGTFVFDQDFGTADNSFSVELADLDGDGDSDAFVSRTDEGNQVWINQGGIQAGTLGQFLDSGQSLGNSKSRTFSLGDLDGDGNLDAFVANNENQANQVWINDGSGTFDNTLNSPGLGSSDSRGIGLGDLDGDGDLDAYVSNFRQPHQVWLNNGIGVFTPGASISVSGFEALEMDLADVDRDGDLDAFVSAVGGQSNRVFLNDGSAGFADSWQQLGNASSVDVELGDLNGDGAVDAVVVNGDGPNKVWLNENDGTGSFSGTQSFGSSNSRHVALGDIDGDGDLDAVEAIRDAANRLWLNDGAGFFTQSVLTLGSGEDTFGLDLGDVDGDGDLDLLFTNFGQPNEVWLNRPQVTLTVTPGSVNEDAGTAQDYTFVIGAPLLQPLIVNFAIVATAFDNEYTQSGADTFDVAAGEGTVTIPAGQLSATVSITPVADNTVEPDETVTLTLTPGPEYLIDILADNAIGTIVNDDFAPFFAVYDNLLSPTELKNDTSITSPRTLTLDSDGNGEFLDVSVGSGLHEKIVQIPLAAAGSNVGRIELDIDTDSLSPTGDDLGLAITDGTHLVALVRQNNGGGKLDVNDYTDDGSGVVVRIGTQVLGTGIGFHEDFRVELDLSATETVVTGIAGSTTASLPSTVVLDPDAELSLVVLGIHDFEQYRIRSVRATVQPITVTPNSIDEGDTVTLTGSFVDGNADDTHTVEIDWGNGSDPQFVEIPVGDRSFSIPYTYDDNPTATPSDINTVSVFVIDNDGHFSLTHTQDVTINNVAPSFVRVLEQQKLGAESGPLPSALFGGRVDIDGEFAVVGASREDVGGQNESGAVYVYQRDDKGNNDPADDTWDFLKKLVRPVGAATAVDRFGSGVAIESTSSTDVTVAVGAPGIDGDETDEGAAYVFVWDGSEWFHEATLQGAGVDEDWFGNSIAIDGDTIVVGDRFEDIGGPSKENSGSAFVFTRGGGAWSQQAKLSAPPGDNNLRDHFGSSVDVDQDTIVVGANGDDGNGTDAGAAYVFVRSGSTWSPAAKLTAEVATSSEFGYDVSVSGDTVVVGAPFDNDLGDNTGAAFVFERQGGANNWSQPVQLTPQDLDAGDKLGVATSIVDDMIVVGASSNQVDGITTGSAYVFERVAGVWSQTTRLVSSDNVNNDQLGIAVATDGESIVAGDHLLDISGTNNAGAAYIYANDGSGWSETEKLVAEVLPAPAFDQQFGWSVDANENYAVVGAPFDVTTDTKQGAAYVYERDDNGTPNPTDDVWNFRTRLAGATGEKFGYSVGVSSDGDVVVGAIFAGTSDQGAAYVFERNHNGTPFDGSDDTWGSQIPLTVNSSAPLQLNDLFGTAVAIDGDTAVVGAPFDNNGDSDRDGSVYFFERDSSGSWSQVQKRSGSHARLGQSLAIDGDIVVAGATVDDGSGADTGTVSIYGRDRDEEGLSRWRQLQILEANDGATNDNYGVSVSISGDRLAVGAFNNDGAGVDSGAAYVYTQVGSSWVNDPDESKLTGLDTVAGDLFGRGVSIEGTTLAIGASQVDDVGSGNSGAAYIFTYDGATWNQQARFSGSDTAEKDKFGEHVALTGATLFASSRMHDTSRVSNAGAAYIFSIEQAGISVDLDAVYEGGTVTLAGTFFDPGTGDTHDVEIDWGDGSPNSIVTPDDIGDRTFVATHLYTDDNPSGTASDVYTISAFVTDDDGQSSPPEIALVTVINVAPAPTISGPPHVPLGSGVSMLAIAHDLGTENEFTYDWVVKKDGNTVATGNDVSVNFNNNQEGLYEVTVTVTDDDGGVGMATATVASIADFGDAPDSYLTTLVSDGARHKPFGPRLGDLRDGEINALGTLDGFGDDLSPIGQSDDEDGVSFTVLRPGVVATAIVGIGESAGRLYAWFDFNADGDFDDAGEQISDGSTILAVGSHNINFTVPAEAATGATFARFRLSTDVGLGVNGLAQNGEVEDYAVLVTPVTVDPAEIRGVKFEDLNGDGVQDAGESGLEGWTIFLDTNGNRNRDAGEWTTTTAADGSYSFLSIPAGDYRVAEIPQAGWLQVFPTPETPAPPTAPPSLPRTGIPSTPVSGTILTDTVWSVANAPYQVNGTVVVQSGATLTIEPGVEVLFDASGKLQAHGVANAIGTAAQPILLTSSATTPASGDWGGVLIDGGSAKLRFTTIEYAINAMYVKDGIPGRVDVQDSTLRHSNAGLSGLGGGDVFVARTHFARNTIALGALGSRVFDSLFTNNIYGLLSVQDAHVVNTTFTGNGTAIQAGSNTLVERSRVRGNTVGVQHTTFGEAILRNNDISANDVGVLFQAASTELLHANNIFDNITFNVANLSSADVDVTNNYWDSIRSADIGLGIHDRIDDETLGSVVFKPFAFAELPTDPIAVGVHEVSVAASSLADNINFGNRLKVAAAFTAMVQGVNEDVGILEIEAQLDSALPVDTTVLVQMSGTAVFEKDYIVTNPNLFFPAGSTSASIIISILDDARHENLDTLVLTLQEGDGVTPDAPSSYEIHITDNDPIPQLSFQTASQIVSEDVGTIQIAVRLTAESDSDVTVPLTFGGTSVTPSDYLIPGGEVIVIPAGSLYGSTNLTIIDDPEPEKTELIIAQLGAVTGGVPSVQAGDPLTQTIIIPQNDEPNVSFLITQLHSVTEATGSVEVVVRLSELSPLPVTVPISLSSLSTVKASDFDLANTDLDFGATPSGQIVISPGQWKGSLTLAVKQDTVNELDETIVLNMGVPPNAVAGSSQRFTMSIADDDAVKASFDSPSMSVSEDAGTVYMGVILTTTSSQPITVPFAFY